MSTEAAAVPMIAVRGVSKSFGAVKVLKDVSLDGGPAARRWS